MRARSEPQALEGDPDAPVTRADLHRMQETILEEIRTQMDRLKKEFLKGAARVAGIRSLYFPGPHSHIFSCPPRFRSAALHVEVTSNVGTDA